MHRRDRRHDSPARRRTALALSAALLAAAPLLTACGGEAHPGAAAVVGGERIDVSSLQAEVKAARDAQAASPQSAQLIAATGDLGRQKLNGMIFDRILGKVAADQGVTVSRAELQETRAAFVRENGGVEGLEAVLLQQQGVAPGQVGDVVRRNVLMTKIIEKLGITETPEGQQKLQELFAAASKSLDIDVNPRYGAWDDTKVQLDTGADTAPWLVQVTRGQGAAGAEQLPG
ncbi:SurA N-terminal domain-containing protein [Streptomyces sp. NRRL F-5727]|uniref:SurA N-terminal domain-containing protein n=1 Tax=Streptomyces sp. NRRL F-5727 TaxID=1463871 RepID=UPI00068D38C7|nr:SurA N-terminal domain-containing protein [Streptomyces sp. NRRL F-5727]